MTDYDPNLANSVTKGCKYIQAVGGLMGERDQEGGDGQPDDRSSRSSTPTTSAWRTCTRSSSRPSRRRTSPATWPRATRRSGKVGTYGGMKIPPVTIFMDGFADGVAAYNKAKGKNVQVLGWDKAKQDGLFTDDFGSQDKGKQKSDTLAAQGADVIFPVAGGAGLGSAANAGTKFVVIWVDADGFETTKYGSVMLTTVVKNSTDGVKEAVTKAAGTPGTLLTGGFMGTLANNGVSLAPYHDFDSKIDAGLKAEVEALKADIISGKIKVESPAQPK